MTKSRVAVVGGGLSGLVAASCLHRAGVDFDLLEARDRLGGRILSVDATGAPSADRFDLGPSWFWPAMQPAMAELVADLGLAAFEQHAVGDTVFERSPGEPPQRYPSMGREPASMRVAGGMGALVAALAERLPPGAVRLAERVTAATLDGDGIELLVERSDGEAERRHHSRVVLALPPRLIEATVGFAPTMDGAVNRRWRDTPTWMAPHAKFVAVYDRHFWREAGLSGSARSMVGPLAEIHDATAANGGAALFGFVGVPAQHRRLAGREAVVEAAARQLVRLFGPEAAEPRSTFLKDWHDDGLTATPADAAGGHPVVTQHPWVVGDWSGRLWLAGSETSLSEPGYLAGAVEAGRRVAAEVVASLASGRLAPPSGAIGSSTGRETAA